MARFRRGWVKLYGKDVVHLLDNCCGFDLVGLYCLILVNTSIADCERAVPWEGGSRIIKRGESVGAYREIAKAFNVNPTTIRFQCMKLEKMGYIKIEKSIGSNRGCIFSVPEWNRHSGNDCEETGWVRLHRSFLKEGKFLSRDLSALGVYCSFLARAHWTDDFSNSDSPAGIECLNGQLAIQISSESYNMNRKGDYICKGEYFNDLIWNLEQKQLITIDQELGYWIITINQWHEMQNGEHFEI